MKPQFGAALKVLVLLMTLSTAMCFVLAALFGLYMIVSGIESDPAARWLATMLMCGAFSAACLACVWIMSRGRMVWLMPIGVIAAILACAVWCDALNDEFAHHVTNPLQLAFAALLTVVAVGVAYTGMMFMLEPKGTYLRLVRVGAVICAWVASVTILAAIVVEYLQRFRELSTFWIVPLLITLNITVPATLLSTILVPLACRIQAKRERLARDTVAARVTLDMTCPNCGHPQRFPCGPARCTRCRYLIEIEIEEPRCECGYLLFQLTGDTCPECGRAISPANHGESAAQPMTSDQRTS